jgi:hypothetical protein
VMTGVVKRQGEVVNVFCHPPEVGIVELRNERHTHE